MTNSAASHGLSEHPDGGINPKSRPARRSRADAALAPSATDNQPDARESDVLSPRRIQHIEAWTGPGSISAPADADAVEMETTESSEPLTATQRATYTAAQRAAYESGCRAGREAAERHPVPIAIAREVVRLLLRA